MNITKYIQENILGDLSAILTRKLDEHLGVVSRDVYDFHNWSWLKKSDTLTLTPGTIEYDLEGNDHDLSKVLAVLYGDDLKPLNDKYDEIGFYKEIYDKVDTSEPGYVVPIQRTNEYTWKVIIYPCDVSAALGIAKYFYKKIFNISDIELFPNPLVFVFGVLGLYFSGKAGEIGDRVESNKVYGLSNKYEALYEARLITMRQNDSALIYPKANIAPSDTRVRVVQSLRTLRDMRNR